MFVGENATSEQPASAYKTSCCSSDSVRMLERECCGLERQKSNSCCMGRLPAGLLSTCKKTSYVAQQWVGRNSAGVSKVSDLASGHPCTHSTGTTGAAPLADHLCDEARVSL